MLKKFRITVDGKPYTVTVEEVVDGSGISSLSAAGAMAVTLPAVAPVATAPVTAFSKPSASGAGDIPSPLGGVVREVKVSVGQKIIEGDLVVVLEAMKMKTNIFSNLTGTVSTVHVKPGDTVDSDQALVTIG